MDVSSGGRQTILQSITKKYQDIKVKNKVSNNWVYQRRKYTKPFSRNSSLSGISTKKVLNISIKPLNRIQKNNILGESLSTDNETTYSPSPSMSRLLCP